MTAPPRTASAGWWGFPARPAPHLGGGGPKSSPPPARIDVCFRSEATTVIPAVMPGWVCWVMLRTRLCVTASSPTSVRVSLMITASGSKTLATLPTARQIFHVSYTHMTLPTIYSVYISVVAVSLKKKKLL